MKTILFSSVLLLSTLGVLSDSQVEVLYSPDSIRFQDTTDALSSTDYAKFVELSLGYSTAMPTNWKGFYGYKNFEHIPKSIITLHMPISLSSISTQRFPIQIESDLDQQYSEIDKDMRSRFSNSFQEQLRLYQKKNGGVKTIEEQFEHLDGYVNKLPKLQSESLLSERLLLWFDFITVQKSSPETLKQFESNITNVVDRLKTLLNDQVIIISIFDPDMKATTRTARAAGKKVDDGKVKDNLAYEFSVDFHSAFVTIAFTSILFMLVVFVITVGMWNIDPGRDSIIYRLTAQKIKKDQ